MFQSIALTNGAAVALTLSNNLFANGSNCNVSGGVAYQIKLNSGGNFPLTLTSNTFDGCGVVDAYCSSAVTYAGDIIVELRAGITTAPYNAFLHSPGRFISGYVAAGANDLFKYNYIEGMVYFSGSHHGEFKEYGASTAGSLSPTFSYNTFLQPSNVSTGTNGSTALIYFSTGQASPAVTFVTAQADHNTMIVNNNYSLSPTQTTSILIELSYDTYNSVLFSSNYADATGSFGFASAISGLVCTGSPTTVWTGNVNMLTGAAISSFTTGSC